VIGARLPARNAAQKGKSITENPQQQDWKPLAMAPVNGPETDPIMAAAFQLFCQSDSDCLSNKNNVTQENAA